MIGKSSQSQIKPSALGMALQSATYGSVIPPIFGRVKSSLYLIWAANLRKADGNGKKGKGKKGKKGKGAPQYAQNVDFLVGSNPIQGVLQVWTNQNEKYPLNFVRFTGGLSAIGRSLAVSDPNFYMVVGITRNEGYRMVVNDYGAPGQVILSGNWEAPMYNTAHAGPNPTNPSSFRNFPYCYYWTPAMGNTVRIELGNIAVGVNIYYAQLWAAGHAAYGKKQTGTAVPIGALHLTFESVLGEGPEFQGNDQTTGQPLNKQQLLYPSYAGLGSDQLNMGSSTSIPDIRPEVLGAYGSWGSGDADFSDMLEDIVHQGIAQSGLTVAYQTDVSGNIVTGEGGDLATPAYTRIQRGLGAFDWPGFIQKKVVGSVEAFTLNGLVYYDQPITAGNILLAAATGGTPGFGVSSLSISDDAGHDWTPIFPDGQGFQVWWAISKQTLVPNAVNIPLGGGGLGGTSGYNATLSIYELAGVDTFEASVIGAQAIGETLATASIDVANQGNYPCFLAAFSLDALLNSIPNSNNPFWVPSVTSDYSPHLHLETRTVYYPGTYTLTQPRGFSPAGWCILAFKATEPSPHPRSLGNLLDEPSLALAKSQCRAFGLYGSLVMNSQKKASDWMETLYEAMITAPVMSGFKLKSIPKSEMSYAGNGSYYTAPTSVGPKHRLVESNFIKQDGEPTILCKRDARTDVPNILQVQCGNRDSDYYDQVISEPETGSIAQYSPRKESPKVFEMIQDAAVARKVLSVMVREQNLVLNTYAFKLNAQFNLLDPMDLVTIPDPDTLLNEDEFGNDISIPVTFTKVEETDTLELDCEAVPFIYGLHAPVQLPTTATAKTATQTGRSPGTINDPVIFEPPPRLCAQMNQGEVWIVVSHAFVPAPVAAPTVTADLTAGNLPSGTYSVLVTYVNTKGAESAPSPATSVIVTLPADASTGASLVVASPPTNPYAVSYNVYIGTQPGFETRQNATPVALGSGYTQSNALAGTILPPTKNYGGSIVYLSTDGGNSYKNVGTISGSADTGIALADWPSAADPDTVNDLLLDITESGGELANVAVPDEDNFVYPCYMQGGGINFIPYELMTYAAATLTGPYHYTLSATAPNRLRRAVFGCPTTQVGVDHPINSRFAFLDPSGHGIFKITMDPLWIGQTLKFKFLPFNNFGGGSPDQADVTVYSYTPIGVSQYMSPNAVNYTNTPGPSLSLTSATTVHMAQTKVQFPSNLVTYNARDFTISGLDRTWYVTIKDPGYLGDIGADLTRTAYIEDTQAKVGAPGYVYMGSIGPAATAGGGSTPVVTPGGWPPTSLYLINGQ